MKDVWWNVVVFTFRAINSITIIKLMILFTFILIANQKMNFITMLILFIVAVVFLILDFKWSKEKENSISNKDITKNSIKNTINFLKKDFKNIVQIILVKIKFNLYVISLSLLKIVYIVISTYATFSLIRLVFAIPIVASYLKDKNSSLNSVENNMNVILSTDYLFSWQNISILIFLLLGFFLKKNDFKATNFSLFNKSWFIIISLWGVAFGILLTLSSTWSN